MSIVLYIGLSFVYAPPIAPNAPSIAPLTHPMHLLEMPILRCFWKCLKSYRLVMHPTAPSPSFLCTPDAPNLIADRQSESACIYGGRKIDIILTKSISRFARNTVDLLQAIRHLKELGVEVRFEKENLSSISSDGELILTLLAAFAEEESSSQSNNVKWSIQKKYEKGLTHAARRCLGYKWEDGHYVIIPEEAEIVKLVFQMYLHGSNCMQIAAHLKECGYKGIKGSYLTPCYVIEILDNITYQGDLRFQYTYSPKVRKQKRNYGEVPRYILSDAHESIISREDFARAKVKRDRDRNIRGRRRETCFSRKIYCGNCGSMLYRATAKLSKTTKKYWNCSLKISSHGTKCKMSNIYESELETICEKIVGLKQFDELIEKVTVFPDYLIFQYYDGKETKWER